MGVRQVTVLVFPQVQAIDVFGPVEVLSAADRLAGGGEYAIELVAGRAGPIETSSGVRLLPDRAVLAARGPLDTLIVAGGDGVAAALGDRRLIRWVDRAAARSRRVCSVCTGAFLLAEAGLLDGRRATTHWAACEELARRHPAVAVEPDPIFVRDGELTTSAGVTAGIDLALALVEEDLGPELAREVARWLVLFLKRPGGQAQFSGMLDGPLAGRPALRALQDWIPTHLNEDLSVTALAERASMSPRNFARAFRRELGTTPAAYVERMRVEFARSRLESGDTPIDLVAVECGFGTVETLRRTFQRRVGASPSQYRERFRPVLTTT
ncbi:MAG TPA: GlxA family transcriptional regulator [Solirubrobacterales bacterium]|nr:GlxA family transcriptional regulator [Solirubrobacterales bacterium]